MSIRVLLSVVAALTIGIGMTFPLNARAEDVSRVRQCAEVLNLITSQYTIYTDTLRSCRQLAAQGQANSHFYSQYKKIARKLETVHQNTAALCFNTCEDTSFCEGELSGACP